MTVKIVSKKTSTFHDFPYSSPSRKCFHCWIINVTPPGPSHCMHHCLYCYAREAIYSDFSADMHIYGNLPELVNYDLDHMTLCPPISISNVSDPCQEVPELRRELKRLLTLLMKRGVSFAITTKGDATFLLDLPGFSDYPLKFVSVTIEGTPDAINFLSPEAAPFATRLEAVRRFSSLGIPTVVRLVPLFLHLYLALYGPGWFREIEELVAKFAATGARHVVSSTGRLSKTRMPAYPSVPNLWQRVHNIIAGVSEGAAVQFDTDYAYERTWAGSGYLLRKDLRLSLHRRIKEVVEDAGMTYATCQELDASDCDSAGLATCEGIQLPFTVKGNDGRFRAVAGCTAMCHTACAGLATPPCGRSVLA
jgi:DNA repair photolyase